MYYSLGVILPMKKTYYHQSRYIDPNELKHSIVILTTMTSGVNKKFTKNGSTQPTSWEPSDVLFILLNQKPWVSATTSPVQFMDLF